MSYMMLKDTFIYYLKKKRQNNVLHPGYWVLLVVRGCYLGKTNLQMSTLANQNQALQQGRVIVRHNMVQVLSLLRNNWTFMFYYFYLSKYLLQNNLPDDFKIKIHSMRNIEKHNPIVEDYMQIFSARSYKALLFLSVWTWPWMQSRTIMCLNHIYWLCFTPILKWHDLLKV